MKPANLKVGVRLRLVLAPGVALGPGKADILQGIKETGSISAAGRRLGMSYKRAWQLVETLNGMFAEPLVAAATGGSGGGGASLTPMGDDVLDCYRRMEARAQRTLTADLDALRGKLSL